MASSNVPLIAQKTGTPITSVGSGTGTLQDTRNLYKGSSSSIDPSLIGALAGYMIGNKTQSTPLTSVANAVKNAVKGPTSTATSPTKVGGTNGSVNQITFPPGTNQATIDQIYGKTNGQPNYEIAGVNMTNGDVIATPNLTIGGSNLTGNGGVSSTGTPPEDYTPNQFFKDSSGNIYDGNKNLYGVNNGGTYYFKLDPNVDAWTNANEPSTVVTSNELFNYTGGGYDPSTDNSNGSYTDNSYDLPTDSNYPIDNSSYSDNPSGGVYKNGGMATPLMAKGGSIPHYLDGGYIVPSMDNVNGNRFLNTVLNPVRTTTPETPTTPTTPTPTPDPNSSSGTLTDITNFLSGSGVQGSIIGALLAKLLASSGSGSNNTYQGVDMSKVGNIAPRTTTFGMGMGNYIPNSDYMPTVDSPLRNASSNTQLNADLGVSGYTPNISPLGNNLLAKDSLGMNKKYNPAYYTYGTPVDAKDSMAKPMADGGSPENEGGMPHGNGMQENINVPMPSGLNSNSNVPVLQGRNDYRKGSYVEGQGDGQSDDIPAMLADGEYVIDADVVAALGNGSNKAGAKVLDKMRHEIRTQKRSAPIDKIPPKAKSPLAYLKGAK